MSHKATRWVWKQRGLSPAQRLVLHCLADHYNPDNGCFPSQATIAEECEISRASVNTHLDFLEKRALIMRHSSVDPETYRQRPTRYFLAFEDGFKAHPEAVVVAVDKSGSRVQKLDTGPCPKTGKSRVQNLDTNPVIINNRNTRAHGRGKKPTPEPVEYVCPWQGDQALRDAVANDLRYGEGYARSYLDTARPVGEGVIAASTRYAAEKLAACTILKARGYRVIEPASAA